MNHPTNSVVDLSADEALDLTARIREKVGEIWPLIVEAFERRAWLALDLLSWEDYCAAHLRGMVPALDRAERAERVAALRESGMSTRAIGQAIGVNQATVVRDLAGDANASPAAAVVGLDGKAYAPTRPVPAPDEPLFPPLTAVQSAQVEQHVAWRDGLAERANGARAPFELPAVEDLPEGLDPAAVGRYAAATQREQSVRYMHEFLKAAGKAWDLLRFDPERVALLADEAEVRAIQELADSVQEFTRKVTASRTGLRLVAGGRR